MIGNNTTLLIGNNVVLFTINWDCLPFFRCRSCRSSVGKNRETWETTFWFFSEQEQINADFFRQRFSKPSHHRLHRSWRQWVRIHSGNQEEKLLNLHLPFDRKLLETQANTYNVVLFSINYLFFSGAKAVVPVPDKIGRTRKATFPAFICVKIVYLMLDNLRPTLRRCRSTSEFMILREAASDIQVHGMKQNNEYYWKVKWLDIFRWVERKFIIHPPDVVELNWIEWIWIEYFSIHTHSRYLIELNWIEIVSLIQYSFTSLTLFQFSDPRVLIFPENMRYPLVKILPTIFNLVWKNKKTFFAKQYFRRQQKYSLTETWGHVHGERC